jgi:hypothetical protein
MAEPLGHDSDHHLRVLVHQIAAKAVRQGCFQGYSTTGGLF